MNRIRQRGKKKRMDGIQGRLNGIVGEKWWTRKWGKTGKIINKKGRN